MLEMTILEMASFFLPPLVFAGTAYFWVNGWVRVMILAHRLYRVRSPQAPPLSWAELAIGAAVFLVLWPWHERSLQAERERIEAAERDRLYRQTRRRKLR